jgi:hypothetical protein|tara:strand:+ start:17 stop:523 length:507 start_codon:yes stop_codon:yes gene_type:complete
MTNTENRSNWYNNADVWEVEFVEKYGERFGVIINPSKSISKYAPDLFTLNNSISGDLKMLKQPFYKSQEIYSIPAQHCWTFNPSDFFEYTTKYCDDFGIFIWKTFEKSSKYGSDIVEEESVYYTTLFELKKLIKKDGKIHHYIRRMNDTNGNSYGSYGIDLRKLHKLV